MRIFLEVSVTREVIWIFSPGSQLFAVICDSRINPQQVFSEFSAFFYSPASPVTSFLYHNMKTKDRMATPQITHSGCEFRIISFGIFKQHWTTWKTEPDNKSEKLKNTKTYLPFQVKHSWDAESKLFSKRWILTDKYTFYSKAQTQSYKVTTAPECHEEVQNMI